MNMSRRLSKKALNEGVETQGSLPDGQGRAVVRGRSPFGFEADRAQGMESHRSKTAREGPPALRVDLPLRLRAPQERRGPLAHLAHRERRGVLDGFGALRKGSGSGKEKTHHPRTRSGRMAHGKEEAKGARRDTPRVFAPSYGIRLYTSRHGRETKFRAIGVPPVRESLPKGFRSGTAHSLAYGLADVAWGFARRGGRDGGLLQEVDHRDRPAL